MIDCCIFDLDGVVVDTARYHYLAWAALARELGFEFTPVQGEATKGVSRMASLEIVLRAGGLEGRFSAAERERLAAEKNARYLRFVSQMTPAEVLPGVAAFLHDVRSRGVRTVLGSASKNAGTILDRCGLRPLFDAVVDGNEVSRAKPDPEVFLKGAAAVDAALGTHSFNAGSSQQLPDGSYYMLKEAAAQNDLKTVYLEMFYTGYNESASSNVPLACYLLVDHMNALSPNRYEYLWEMGGLAAFADLLLPARHGIASLSGMPALWQAKLADGYTTDSYRYVTYEDSGEAYRGRGFVYTAGIPQDGFATLLNVDPDAPLSDFGWEYLNKITDFCQENGIQLVLFTAPLPSGYLYNTQNYQAYVDALQDFCTAHAGLEYWDFSLYRLQRDLNLKIEDFSDAHHLNGAGAEKFTAILCQTIQERAAGKAVDEIFYPTVEEKLTLTPDDSILMAKM